MDNPIESPHWLHSGRAGSGGEGRKNLDRQSAQVEDERRGEQGSGRTDLQPLHSRKLKSTRLRSVKKQTPTGMRK